MADQSSPAYSIVVPAFNEAESLMPFLAELTAVMTKLHQPWELIVVNDGSTDATAATLVHLQAQYRQLSVVTFGRNRGKAAGLSAGFAAARGQILVTLDADLQDDPAELPKLVAKLEQGFDLVTGRKANRQDPLDKTVPSRVINGLARWLTGVAVRDSNSGFKAYRREVVEHIPIYGELYRFIPILAASEGFAVTEVPVHHRPRRFGRSKYGASRFIRGAFDLLTVTVLIRFLRRPLHLFGTLGMILVLAGLAISADLTYLHFVAHQSVGDRPLLAFGILFLISGLQLVCTGLLAELLVYLHQRGALRSTVQPIVRNR